MGSFILGIDVGGTFTDASLVETDSQSNWTAKASTTTEDLTEGVLNCLNELAELSGYSVSEILSEAIKFAHGTTQTSNLIFTRTGAKVGLITTRGFADQILFMGGKGRVAGLSLRDRRHFRITDKPDPLVPRHLIREVPERIDYRGAIITPLDKNQLRRALDELAKEGVEALAICFLWSFANEVHEAQALDVAREENPDLYVSVSKDVAPLIGEYERTATTVVNAYVGPGFRDYLEDLQTRLKEQGLTCPLLILQANGGVAEVGETLPVRTIESGPAAGVVAVKHLADTLGEPNVIATDVGGTTFKVSLVSAGEWTVKPETVIGQYSIQMPMVDVVSIGAGGGSIAWADDNRLRVGPASAGADPGPACYGWGGTDPTVTDADLVLGYLNPDYFLGGKIQLDPGRARTAIRQGVAEELVDGDVTRAAAGIKKVIDSRMADLIRKSTIERGHDPRDFVLMAYGGAGPAHCGAYGAELGIERVIIPADATVYSAFGAAVSDIRHTFQRTDRMLFPLELGRFRRNFQALKEQAYEVLKREGVARERIRLLQRVYMRYRRQMHEVRVPLERSPTDLKEDDLEELVRTFEARYESLYGPGAGHHEAGLELVTFEVEAVGPIEKPRLNRHEVAQPNPASVSPTGSRQAYWPELDGWADTPVYHGPRLVPTNRISGPAIIEYPGTTVVIHPGQTTEVDAYLNVILHLENTVHDPELTQPDHL